MPKKSKVGGEEKKIEYYPVGIPKAMLNEIDKILAESKAGYVSRQDFVRDAIRRRLDDIK